MTAPFDLDQRRWRLFTESSIDGTVEVLQGEEVLLEAKVPVGAIVRTIRLPEDFKRRRSKVVRIKFKPTKDDPAARFTAVVFGD